MNCKCISDPRSTESEILLCFNKLFRWFWCQSRHFWSALWSSTFLLKIDFPLPSHISITSSSKKLRSNSIIELEGESRRFWVINALSPAFHFRVLFVGLRNTYHFSPLFWYLSRRHPSLKSVVFHYLPWPYKQMNYCFNTIYFFLESGFGGSKRESLFI